MKSDRFDTELLRSLTNKDINFTKLSENESWDDLIKEIEKQWGNLRRTRETSRENGIVLSYRFNRTASDFVKFSVKITHEQSKAIINKLKSIDNELKIEQHKNAPDGGLSLSSRPKTPPKPKRVFWRQAPGSYGSTQ
jgi:hypothetical protein